MVNQGLHNKLNNARIGFSPYDLLEDKRKADVIIKTLILYFIKQTEYLTNRKGFSVVCTLIDNDIRHHGGQNVVDSRGAANTEPLSISFLPQYSKPKKVFISERDQTHDTKKEQALSITFSQYDWFISQNEGS